MTTLKPIDFEHLGIAEVLKRYRLIVPLHQREYSWTEKEVEALFQDLTAAVSDKDSVYFLGTIVLTRQDDHSMQVVDGQQRMATVSILLAAIRDYLYELDDKVLVTALEDFLFTIVLETRERSPRLRLNVDDDAFFLQRILHPPNDKSRKKIEPSSLSHTRIEKAAAIAKKHVEAIVEPYSAESRIDSLLSWVRFLQTSAQIILAIATNEENAFVMFETLNDRGLHTSQADLLKNYLFSQTKKRIEEAQHKWSSMRGAIDALEDDRDLSMTYLRHLTISRFGHTRERDVLVKIRAKIKRQLDAIQFLDSLAKSANDYVALLTPEHALWNKYSGSIRAHVKTISSTLQITPLRPLMLSVVQRMSKTEVEKTFRQMVHWSVRFLICGGLRSGALEEAVAVAASDVYSGKIKKLAQLKARMSNVIPSDAEFRSTFSTKRVSQNRLARYYLRALELKRKGNPEPELIPNADIVINLEHVLPIHQASEWEAFDPGISPMYCKRLGNMALLQASKNAEIGNDGFSTKKKVYRKSTFLMTKEIAECSSWGPLEIDTRQLKMAKLAVKTWPL